MIFRQRNSASTIKRLLPPREKAAGSGVRRSLGMDDPGEFRCYPWLNFLRDREEAHSHRSRGEPTLFRNPLHWVNRQSAEIST